MKKIIYRFFLACQFLTIIPIPKLKFATDKEWSRILSYFVLAGFLISSIIIFTSKIFIYIGFSKEILSLSVLLVWCLLTGSLHVDGFMDMFDGIGCTKPERRIEAMRDSRVGAFGVLGGFFLLLYKLFLLNNVFSYNQFMLLFFAIPFGRLMGIYGISFYPSNSDNGKSSNLLSSGARKPQDFLLNLFLFVITFIFSIFCFNKSLVYILIFVFSFLISLLFSKYINKKFNGFSGDTYGGLIEFAEVMFLFFGYFFRAYIN